MWTRRLIAAGVVVLMAAPGAGCSSTADGTGTGPASPAPRPPATIPSDPAAALASAKAHLGTESARFAQDTGHDRQNFTGIVNAETKNWEITGKEFAVRRVGTEVYVRASGKSLDYLSLPQSTFDRLAAGGWAHTRLPNGRELSVLFNDNFPWNLANPAARATGVTRTGTRSFAGTVSITEGKYTSRPKTSKLRLGVALDDQGRFTSIALSATEKTVFTFSDYGTSADITAPSPSDVVEEENPSFMSSLLPY